MQSIPVTVSSLPKDAQESDIKATKKTLQDAFHDEIFTHILLGGHLEFVPEFFSSMVDAALIGGEIYVAKDINNSIIGATVWFPPGHDFMDSEEQGNAGFNDFMAKLIEASSDMSAWWTEYFGPLASEFCKKTFGDPHYPVKCWYLYLIGVAPACQRRGVGTALMNDGESQIKGRPGPDEQSKTIAVGATTDRAADFYYKRRFIEKGRVEVKSIAELDEVVMMRFCTKVVN